MSYLEFEASSRGAELNRREIKMKVFGRFLTRYGVLLVLSGWCAGLGVLFSFLLSSQTLPSEDLPAHIALVERLSSLGWSGLFPFYHRGWFSGWTAFQYYGPLAHWVAACLSVPFRVLSSNPEQLAVYAVLWLNIICLPLSLYYSALPFAREACRKNEWGLAERRWLLALSCGLFSTWFLYHDEQFFGLGVGAILYVGLFSQSVAWNLLLLGIGALARITGEDKEQCYGLLGTVLLCLLLTHLLTAFYFFALCGVVLLWFADIRAVLLKVMALALLCSGFWLMPFLTLAPVFATSDPYPPSGDFLQFLFRYPLQYWRDLVLTFPLDLTPILILAVSVFLFTAARIRDSRFFIVYLVLLLLLQMFFSSSYVASSLPVGVHYYRTHGYLVLSLLPVLAAGFLAAIVPRVSSDSGERYTFGIRDVAALCVVVVCVGTRLLLPSLEQSKAQQLMAQRAYVHQEKLMDYLRAQGAKGRVLVEYLDDYRRYPYLSSHYLESKLFSQTGLEALNGLFVESALSNKFASFSADKLSARIFHSYFVFLKDSNIDPFTALEQLRDLGVRYIVSGQDALLKSLRSLGLESVASFGPYRLVVLPDAPQSMITPVTKRVVAYLDEGGGLPFKFIEYYFYANKFLSSRFEVIEVSSREKLPAQVDLLLVNTENPVVVEDVKSEIKLISFGAPRMLEAYRRSYPIHRATEYYRALKKYLDVDAHLAEELSGLAETSLAKRSKPETDTVLGWDSDQQSMSLTGLVPGEMYRINYSYAPQWFSSSGQVFRGSAERMFFVASAPAATLKFSPFYLASTWAGVLTSIVGLLLFGRYLRWRKKNLQKIGYFLGSTEVAEIDKGKPN